MLDTINQLLQRELQKLEDEIKFFTDETLLWKTSGEIKNSAGNLCLHLCGNLQHFIGAVIGKTGYVRNRDAEFSSKNISMETLIDEIQKTKKSVAVSLKKLTEADLQKIYTEKFRTENVITEFLLMHLLSHFDYHLGQVNYLRRMIANS